MLQPELQVVHHGDGVIHHDVARALRNPDMNSGR